jgi:hypothetical protein
MFGSFGETLAPSPKEETMFTQNLGPKLSYNPCHLFFIIVGKIKERKDTKSD